MIRFALDRSVRRRDIDGHLHVELTPISKAQISPYYGSEIPNAEELGLDPSRIYQMLRPADELMRAAPTFCGKPLMDNHVAVSADDPQKERIVGSLGNDACFVAPYLRCSVSIWDADAIARIESGEQREISCGYRYTPDMTPGVYEGLPYDGIMRNIMANHVALVPQGRAGPDVLVADTVGEPNMKLALMARGAIAAYVKPLLAQDAKLDLKSAFAGVTDKNFSDMRPVIVGRIANDAKGKLIEGASLAGLDKALDALEDETCEDADEDEDKAEDADEPEDDDKDQGNGTEGEKPTKDEDPPMKPEAMDAAIQKGVQAGLAAHRAYDAALAEVRPHVGEVHGCDTAAAVFKFALDSQRVEYDRDVHPSAYASIWRAHRNASAHVAQDAAPSYAPKGESFFDSIPGANRF